MTELEKLEIKYEKMKRSAKHYQTVFLQSKWGNQQHLQGLMEIRECMERKQDRAELIAVEINEICERIRI